MNVTAILKRAGEILRQPKIYVARFIRSSLARWLLVGILFMVISNILLFISVEFLNMSFPVATAISAELSTLLRFFANDWWVFSHGQFSWKRMWQYHVANVGAFVIWWGAANTLASFGVHYLIAGIAAVCFSTICSMLSNFLWVWRHPVAGESTMAEALAEEVILPGSPGEPG